MVEPTAQAVARRVNRVAAANIPAPHSTGLYRAAMFDLGAWLARIFPLTLLRALAGIAGWLYALIHPRRVAVVRRNLQLLDTALGEKAARNAYAASSRKSTASSISITRRNSAKAR
jgi:lauroyl/myristoyl acyltransferase